MDEGTALLIVGGVLSFMGVLMNMLKTNHSGSVNMTVAGKIAKSILNN